MSGMRDRLRELGLDGNGERWVSGLEGVREEDVAAALAGGGCAAGVRTACRVCLSGGTRRFMVLDGREYRRCVRCGATLVNAADLPDAETELAEYMLHENDPQDARYRNFLRRLTGPLEKKLRRGMEGLDFGCGPGPALGAMLAEKGYAVSLFDPFFCPDASVLERTYDFIVCTEVVEHFHEPGREFARLDRMLKAGGWLGIMTCFQTDDGRFADWHYRRDRTHVAFYRRETFEHIAGRFGWKCEIPADNVVLMQKGGAGGTSKDV